MEIQTHTRIEFSIRHVILGEDNSTVPIDILGTQCHHPAYPKVFANRGIKVSRNEKYKYTQNVSRGTMKVILDVDISSIYPLLPVCLSHIHTCNTFTCSLGPRKHFSRLWKKSKKKKRTNMELWTFVTSTEVSRVMPTGS